MSHVTQSKHRFHHLSDMEAAAKRLGGELIRDQHTYRMFSSGFVDDSTDWKSMFEPAEAERIARMSRSDRVKVINQAMSHADHVIKFPGCRYDVGVVKQQDGSFALRWDYYGEGGLNRYLGNKEANLFAQAYTIEASKRAARIKGYVTREKKLSSGQIELEMLAR